jgi:hypothetical protein
MSTHVADVVLHAAQDVHEPVARDGRDDPQGAHGHADHEVNALHACLLASHSLHQMHTFTFVGALCIAVRWGFKTKTNTKNTPKNQKQTNKKKNQQKTKNLNIHHTQTFKQPNARD